MRVHPVISRLHLSAILLIAASVWGVALIIAGFQVTADWFEPFSVVVGVLMVLLSIADKWLWRVKWLRPWLFNMPDVHGTWRVSIQSTAPAESPTHVSAFMVIRQTFSTISLRLYTAESQSETLSARVLRCDDGTCNIAAVYRNTSRLEVRARSPLHHGALLLSVQGDPPETLSGQYWTDRLSQGDITLSGRSSGFAYSYEQALKLLGGTRPSTTAVSAHAAQ